MKKYKYIGSKSQMITIDGKTTNLLPDELYDLPSDHQKVKTLLSMEKLELMVSSKTNSSSNSKNAQINKSEEIKSQTLDN